MFSFAACNDTDDGSYVAPITTYEKIKGDWKLTSVKQIDEVAKANSQSPSEMVLTSQFDFSTFTIKLNVDANNEPTDYAVGGNAPAIFAKAGYWKLAYPFPSTDGAASIIYLYSDAAKTAKIGELAITATPGATDVLELKLTRKTKGVAFVSYVYRLSPNVNE
ncbi:DUF5004 domain-containing protein [Dysgonomonas sp. 521]|nr:DUF5004 domain-containing protein [Dysgonomonas sp. 521]